MSCVYCNGNLSVEYCNCYLATRARKYNPIAIEATRKEKREVKINDNKNDK